jgi:hypothetical protein
MGIHTTTLLASGRVRVNLGFLFFREMISLFLQLHDARLCRTVHGVGCGGGYGCSYGGPVYFRGASTKTLPRSLVRQGAKKSRVFG